MATILKATTPAEAHRFWGEAFNSRDVDALLSLYEDGAAMLGDPGGSLARGREDVREVLEGFLSFGATFTLERTKVLENGDLAIVYSQWRLSGGADPEEPRRHQRRNDRCGPSGRRGRLAVCDRQSVGDGRGELGHVAPAGCTRVV